MEPVLPISHSQQSSQTVPLISVVCPVYYAELSLRELTERCARALQSINLSYEIIFVDDRSPDHSWKTIQSLCAQDPRVKGIRLSRNFGQHAAITAGIELARGKNLCILDCDLQHDPQFIPLLYEKIAQGYDIVYTYAEKPKHSLFKKIAGALFHKFFNWLSENNIESSRKIGNFSMISRRVANAFLKIKDQHRHYRMILQLLGFTSTVIEIEHKDRPYGKSSYSFQKLVMHAIDGLISQSTRVLRLSIVLGFLVCFGSFVYATYLCAAYFMHRTLVGWTSTNVIILFCTGILLIFMGIIGAYVGKIFEQVKERPIYLVDSLLNFEAETENARERVSELLWN